MITSADETRMLLDERSTITDRQPAFDEAFAHLSEELDVRFDSAQAVSPCGGETGEAELLLSRVRDQLRVIEQHRDRLVGLLRDLSNQGGI